MQENDRTPDMVRGRSAGWRKLGLAAGLLVLAWGCDTSRSPVDPTPQEPGGPQAPGNQLPAVLEVSIDPSGTRPDPDGFTVLLSLGNGAVHLRTVGPEGGTVRFPDLPPGRHLVGVESESVAPTCSVQDNQRRLNLAAGETRQVTFTVACPGPGTLLVSTRTTGTDQDDSYIVSFRASSTNMTNISTSTNMTMPLGANDSLRIGDVPPGARISVSLLDIAANCWSVPTWKTGEIPGDSTARVEFTVECMPWTVFNSGIIYERVGPNSYGRFEQYILLSNGRFRLRHFGGDWDDVELLGAYTLQDASTVSFQFDGAFWPATGTFKGDSLLVEYSGGGLAFDDGFEDGVFVRSP